MRIPVEIWRAFRGNGRSFARRQTYVLTQGCAFVSPKPEIQGLRVHANAQNHKTVCKKHGVLTVMKFRTRRAHDDAAITSQTVGLYRPGVDDEDNRRSSSGDDGLQKRELQAVANRSESAQPCSAVATPGVGVH